MKKIFSIAAIILLASGYASGADYWHFGLGARVTGVITGGNYSNALGGGILATFGNPESKFTTQIDLDTWGVSYTTAGDLVRTSPITEPDAFKIREHKYSGLGVGIFEKYRVIDFSETFSSYILGGVGGYFLEYQQEESFNGTVRMTSKGLHALGQLAGGVGFESRFSQHTIGFIEGRYVGLLKAKPGDKDLMKGYAGIRFIF